MGIEWVKGDIRTVNKQEAEQLLEYNVHPDYQRELKVAHAKHLAYLLEINEFIATGSLVIVHMADGSKRCANGMHTLHGIVISGVPARCLVEQFRCDTNADYIKLFHAYDTENRKRTFRDSAQAFMMGDPGLPKMSASSLDKFRSGVEVAAMFNGQAKARTRYDRFVAATRMRDEMDLFLWLEKQSSDKLMSRAPVVAAVLTTYGKNPTQSRAFWRQVMTGFFDEHDDDYPPVRLQRWLQSVSLHGSQSSGIKTPVTREAVFTACMRCWDAFLDGRHLKSIRTGYKNRVPTGKHRGRRRRSA